MRYGSKVFALQPERGVEYAAAILSSLNDFQTERQ